MQFPCMDALSYSHFCEGKIDTVFQSGNKIWDIYPLIPIIKASGGIVTNWENKENFKSGNVLISSSRLIHEQMLKMLKINSFGIDNLEDKMINWEIDDFKPIISRVEPINIKDFYKQEKIMKEEENNIIQIDDFMKVDLRVARIEEASHEFN